MYVDQKKKKIIRSTFNDICNCQKHKLHKETYNTININYHLLCSRSIQLTYSSNETHLSMDLQS